MNRRNRTRNPDPEEHRDLSLQMETNMTHVNGTPARQLLVASLLACTTLLLAGFMHRTPHQETPAAETASSAWQVDTVHSCALFRVRHLGAGYFWGRFNDVSGTVNFDPADAKSLSMNIAIDVDSVDSGHPGLDRHLKSPDFFDSKEFPKMTFKSASVTVVPTTKRSDDPVTAWDVKGTLSMRGQSKDVTARVMYWGANDAGRGLKAGFEATFKMKRSDFGMNYGVENKSLGDMVTVTVAFEVNKDG